MEPSQVLERLLDQHRELRKLLADVEHRAAMAEVAHLRHALVRLRNALQQHNADEEATLMPLLPDADAWGAVRIQAMLAEHAAEHAMLCQVVEAALTSHDREAIGRSTALVGELRAHMDAEERGFLSDRVLRDDAVTLDPMGG
jgi:hypothetical protein